MKTFAVLACVLLLLAAAPAFSQQLQDNFFIALGMDGEIIRSGGTGYNNGYWYVYPSGWINQWFYDHPFDPTRGKIIRIEFDWASLTAGALTDIKVVLNWSTPEWSALGYGSELPPTPDFDENLYIWRACLMSQYGSFPPGQYTHFARDFIIYAYNPEWVSIDVRGFNFEVINGIFIHECAVGTEESTWGGIKALFR